MTSVQLRSCAIGPSCVCSLRRDGFLRNSEKLRGELRLWTPELAPHQQSPSAPV